VEGKRWRVICGDRISCGRGDWRRVGMCSWRILRARSLLVGNQKRRISGLLTFSKFDCPLVGFAWFIEVLSWYIAKRSRSGKPNVG
jgi:hypothetical protein